MEGSFGSLHARAGLERPVLHGGVRVSVIGPILIAIGVIAGLAGWALLRRSGGGWRIGRLLAAAPPRSLAEAAAIAASGEETYVRVHGRIHSDEEFPGDDGQPLVYRRRRLQRRAGRDGWQTFDDQRLAVPFGLREGEHGLRIDVEALGDGLVVVPRESEGVAADVTEDAIGGPLPEMAPDTPVRLRIERVSTTDHATAAGVARTDPDGVVLGPGLGRPLLLSTLEQDEAMRILAEGQRRRLLLATGLLVASPIVVVLGLIGLMLGW